MAILAGGPSVTQARASAVLAAGLTTIVINDAWEIAPQADVLLAADVTWWQEHPAAMAFKGEKITMQLEPIVEGVKYMAPVRIGPGSNSALQAAYLATMRHATCLLLLGVDLRDDELTHRRGYDFVEGPSVQTFRLARQAWKRFAAQVQRPSVVNCSERSALNCFRRMPLDQALC